MSGDKLSLCMIVKDEESQLPRCLASVQGVVDELIVVDTGSTDETVAIATAAGAKVLHHTWSGDFSAARNVSLDAATGDWVLILDADEVLSAETPLRAALRAASEATQAFVLPIVNFVGERAHEEAVTAPSVRVFRNNPVYRYARALHEQIMFAIYDHRPDAVLGFVDAPIEHYGYLNQLVCDRDKIRRNIEIARLEVERYPEDAFSWYNLGQEHFRLAEWEQAIEAYQKGFPYLDSLLAGFAPALIKHLTVSLLNLNRNEDAITVCLDSKEVYDEFTDLWVLHGLALLQQGQYLPAAEQFQIAYDKGEVGGTFYMSDEGVGSYKALWWLANCRLHLGQIDEAAGCYLGSLAELAQRNRYLPPPIDGLLQCYRLWKVSDEKVVGKLAEHLDLRDPRWANLVIQRLLASGLTSAGLSLARQTADLVPETLLAVGMARLQAGDVSGAEQLWSEIPAEHPVRLEADWHQLLALVTFNRLDAAEHWFAERIEPRGEGELVALYRGLLALWHGVDPAGITDPALEFNREVLQAHLAGVLGLFLAVGAHDAFGRALPALDWVGFSEAGQAALLGRLYQSAGLDELAFEALLLAIEAGDDSDETLRSPGLLCLRRGQYAEAEEILGVVLRRQSETELSWTINNTTLLGYLSALSAQGKDSEADPLWQRILKPSSPARPVAAVG